MNSEEKNASIVKYIDNLADQLNNQYNGIVDDEKKQEALDLFIDSPLDFDTEIVPRLNELAQQLIKDYLLFLKQLEELMKKNHNDQMEKLATLDLNTEKDGLYLSQQQIDLLMITEIESKDEMQDFVQKCAQFPNKNLGSIISNFESISSKEELEEAKKSLYSEYQRKLIAYDDYSTMSDSDRAKGKLKKLGIPEKELEICLSLISQGNIKEAINYLGNNFGDGLITALNRFMDDDFENVKGVSYDEMKSLSDLIRNDEAIDTIIIATGKIGNTMYQTRNGKQFDPYLLERGASYCSKHGKHMRYHALFDHYYVDTIINKYINLDGRSIDQLTNEEINELHSHKEEILTEMRYYVRASLNEIMKLNNNNPGLIQIVEVFNELIEKNKSNKNSPYSMVWEKYFGINIEEMMNCFPKTEDGKIMEPEGVSFMYNETTLTESQEKRKSVERMLYLIEQIAPGFIDIFGDQMHLSDEDVMTLEGTQNLTETAQMLERIQDGKIIVDGQLKDIIPKKTECTEHDFHFTNEFMNMFEKINPNISLWEAKRISQEIISNIYNQNGVKFDRSTYWTIFGKNDHNIVRTNTAIQKKGKKPSHDTLHAGLVPEGKTLTGIKSLKSEKEVKKEDKIEDKIEEKIENKKEEPIKEPFAKRSQSEIQIAEQINHKNQMIKQEKAMTKKKDNEKIKVLVYPNNKKQNETKGYANMVILSLVISFVTGALFMIVYFLLGR